MGFREGSAAIFGKGAVSAEERDVLTEGGAANFGSLMRQLQKDKADLAAKEKDSAAKNLESIMKIINNAAKLPKGLRKSSVPVLSKFMQAEGLRTDESFLQNFVGDDEALSVFAQLADKLQTASPEERPAVLAQLGPIVDGLAAGGQKGMEAILKAMEGGEGGLEVRQEIGKRAGTLRKEAAARLKNEEIVATSYKNMLNLYKDIRGRRIDGGNMQAFVVLFNKLIDPNSVVRESEFARTQQFGTLLERMKNWFGAIERGEFLQPSQVDAIFRASTLIAGVAEREMRKKVAKFQSFGQFEDIPPELLDLPTTGLTERIGQDPESFIEELQNSADEIQALQPQTATGGAFKVNEVKGFGPGGREANADSRRAAAEAAIRNMRRKLKKPLTKDQLDSTFRRFGLEP